MTDKIIIESICLTYRYVINRSIVLIKEPIANIILNTCSMLKWVRTFESNIICIGSFISQIPICPIAGITHT